MGNNAIALWMLRFDARPAEAVEGLFFRKVYMGVLHPCDPDEILFRLFSHARVGKREALDGAMIAFFEKHWGQSCPEDIHPNRWYAILRDTLCAVRKLKLRAAQKWVSEHLSDEIREWLQTLDLERDVELTLGGLEE